MMLCSYTNISTVGVKEFRSVAGPGSDGLTNLAIRYDTIEKFNVDSKAEYSALSSTRSQKKN